MVFWAALCQYLRTRMSVRKVIAIVPARAVTRNLRSRRDRYLCIFLLCFMKHFLLNVFKDLQYKQHLMPSEWQKEKQQTDKLGKQDTKNSQIIA